jgi:nucleotide-binding universal stress UspA family protein
MVERRLLLMANYRKILVAYDGSASARNGLAVASHLAKEDKSWIKVLTVLPNYEGDLELVGVSNIKETIEGPGKKLLQEAKEIADHEDVHILTNMAQGEPYDKIIHVADDENCDLIVMGRRGQHHMERELVGSVTARVIGHTRKDVLVVPEGTGLTRKNILLATDGSPSCEAAVDRAIALAKEQSADLTAISVVYSNDEYLALAPHLVDELIGKAKEKLATIEQKGKDAGVNIDIIVKEGEAFEAITNLAKNNAIDLIVMGSHGRTGLHRILMGSVTERTIGYAPCPVLVVH